MQIELPSISYVVARSWPDGIIGRDNTLPWRLRSDLQRFKAITLHHVIIMGRRTYVSVGRPLPQRVNIILSRTAKFDDGSSIWEDGETMRIWAEDCESALFFADVMSVAKDQSDVFVIGGAEMYRAFGDLCNKVYLTEVLTGEAIRREPNDTVFEYDLDPRQWRTLESQLLPSGSGDDYPSRFTVLERKAKRTRSIEVDDGPTESQAKKHWLARQFDAFDRARLASPERPIKVAYQYRLFQP